MTASASGGSNAYGFYCQNSAGSVLSGVTVTASSSSTGNYGIALEGSGIGATINDSRITAQGGAQSFGVSDYQTALTLNNVSIAASQGTNTYSASVWDATTSISNSKITALCTALAGSSTYGVNNYSPLAGTVIKSSSISASGAAGYNVGIWNYYGATMRVDGSDVSGTVTALINGRGGKLYLANARLNLLPAWDWHWCQSVDTTTVCHDVCFDDFVTDAACTRTCP